MINDTQVASHQFVLETGSVGDHDLVTLSSDQDTSSSESDTFTEPNVT